MSDNTVPASRLAIEARDNFLAHYKNGTLTLYELDLRIFFDWCADAGTDPLDVRRSTLERFVNDLMNVRGNSPRSAVRRFQTVRSFYRLAAADEIIDRDPTWMVRLPKWSVDRSTIAWLDKHEMGRLLRAAEATSPAHHALIALMGMLGLRVSEACGARLEDIREDNLGYTTLTVTRKGGKEATVPVPVPLLRIIERARGGRTMGTIVVTKRGNPQTRNGAYLWVKTLAKRAGLPENVHPHSLRHGAVSALVDAGVPMHEAQEFAGHADIRTTAHYYHRPLTLDQHGAHVTARVFAGAAA